MTSKRMPREIAEAVLERADEWCDCMIPGVCLGTPQHIHHRQMRSQGGQHTLENCGAICHKCHDAIHRHTAWAYDTGWLVHGWDTPTWPPAFYRGVLTREEEEWRESGASSRSSGHPQG